VCVSAILLKRASVRFYAKLGLRISNSLRRKFPARLTGHPSVHLESENCTHLMPSESGCQNHAKGGYCFMERKHGPFEPHDYYPDPRDPQFTICSSCLADVKRKLKEQHPQYQEEEIEYVHDTEEEEDEGEPKAPKPRSSVWGQKTYYRPKKPWDKKNYQKTRTKSRVFKEARYDA